MVELRIGRNGTIVLLAAFVLLAAEDVLIFYNRGVVPGVEFFLASVLVLGVLATLVRSSLDHDPGA